MHEFQLTHGAFGLWQLNEAEFRTKLRGFYDGKDRTPAEREAPNGRASGQLLFALGSLSTNRPIAAEQRARTRH